MSAEETDFLEAIRTVVHARTGVDFANYRAATVRRRIGSRMVTTGATGAGAYLELLRRNRGEAGALIGQVTIKISRLYRDPAAFDYLRHYVVPQLARRGKPVKVWSAGCARGEEAYTLA